MSTAANKDTGRGKTGLPASDKRPGEGTIASDAGKKGMAAIFAEARLLGEKSLALTPWPYVSEE